MIDSISLYFRIGERVECSKTKYGRKVIFSQEDGSHLVEVMEEGDRRSLHFGTACQQSEMSLQNPFDLVIEYFRLMALSLLFQPNPKKVLMLGLGGGSLPKFLWKSFSRCRFDLIERSSLVVDVSHRYFALPRSPRLRIEVTDAFDFIWKTDSLYDLLFVDLYDGNGVPERLGNTEFFSHCKKRLKDKKSLLVWNLSAHTPEPLLSLLFRQIGAAFGSNILIFPTETGGNYVFLASLETREILPWEIAYTAVKLQEKTHFPFSTIWKGVEKIVFEAKRSNS